MCISRCVPLTESPIFCVSGGSSFCTEDVISTPGLNSYASPTQHKLTSFITFVGTLFTYPPSTSRCSLSYASRPALTLTPRSVMGGMSPITVMLART